MVSEVVRAWVDDIPDQELSIHYAKAIADLDEDDLHLLAAWHASLEVGQPVPNTEFLVGVFASLGEILDPTTRATASKTITTRPSKRRVS